MAATITVAASYTTPGGTTSSNRLLPLRKWRKKRGIITYR